MTTIAGSSYAFFAKNAHFFLTHKDAILADKRMAGALVPYEMGLPSKQYPLAAYLLYWEKSDFARSVDDSEQSLIMKLGGFPLSGTCFVSRVNEQGEVIRETTDCFLKHIHEFMDLAEEAIRLYVDTAIAPFTLSEVKEKLLDADSMGKVEGNNIRNYLLIADEELATESFRKNLKAGNYAWLTLKNCEPGTPHTIIFNLSLTSYESLCKKYGCKHYVYIQVEKGLTAPSVISGTADCISSQSIQEACQIFNETINRLKKEHERYCSHFEVFLQKSLEENKTGYSYYINRTMLYGGVF